jgi:FAD/FMN-containing dehydrogenase
MVDKKNDLIRLVGESNIFTDSKTLQDYSKDNGYASMMKPELVVKPKDANDVQKIIEWANTTSTPLIPVSSGPPHFRGDTIPGVPGAVILDMSDLKKIMKVNRRNRLAIIEAGVTYGELQPVLAKEGMMLSTSLLPKANKSVVASLLEREPVLNARYLWSSLDPLRSLEIIFGDGNKLGSGGAGGYLSFGASGVDHESQWAQERWPVDPSGPAQIDFYRLLSAAQGSIGVATWASVKCEVLPVIHKLFFVPAKRLEELTDFTSKLLRFRYADELFIMNGANLAYVLGENPDQIKKLKQQLPPWIVILGIAGRTELPEERVDFMQKDIAEIATQFGLKMEAAIPGAGGAEVLDTILSPSREPYWKFNYKGGCRDIFFITTLDKTTEFLKTMNFMAEGSKYPVSDIGVYLQPRHQGVNCHCEFNLPYEPEQETTFIHELFIKASESLINQGAFFSRPYGVWAEMAFKRDEQSTKLLKNIKRTFDPNNIMNPGKLCF